MSSRFSTGECWGGREGNLVNCLQPYRYWRKLGRIFHSFQAAFIYTSPPEISISSLFCLTEGLIFVLLSCGDKDESVTQRAFVLKFSLLLGNFYREKFRFQNIDPFQKKSHNLNANVNLVIHVCFITLSVLVFYWGK